ncbi:MAG: hypothetical protein K1X95_15225 [Acidimicrobiia bacterium]|nr:hypothetical protein [Acidimicrobiia bacterium]
MADTLVAPVADPIIDTVHDIEVQVLEIAEGFVDQTDIKPVTDSAFSLARSIFAVQRDVSRKLVDAVDQTISSVTATVEGVISDSGTDAPKPKQKPAAAKTTAGKSA